MKKEKQKIVVVSSNLVNPPKWTKDHRHDFDLREFRRKLNTSRAPVSKKPQDIKQFFNAELSLRKSVKIYENKILREEAENKNSRNYSKSVHNLKSMNDSKDSNRSKCIDLTFLGFNSSVWYTVRSKLEKDSGMLSKLFKDPLYESSRRFQSNISKNYSYIRSNLNDSSYSNIK